MTAHPTRAFWLLALVAWPAAGFAIALPFVGSRSDELSLPLALGLPPVFTFLTGRSMGVPATQNVVAAALSSAVAFLFVLVFLWYLFEVKGVS